MATPSLERAVEQMSRQVEALTARVHALEDERAILRTLHSYAQLLDAGQNEQWLDLFTEDGVLDVQRRSPGGINQPHKHTGKAELREFVAHHSQVAAPPHAFPKHFFAAPIITLTGNEARVEQYAAGLDDTPTGPLLGRFGRTRDHLVKEGGRWRIKEHLILTDVARTA